MSEKKIEEQKDWTKHPNAAEVAALEYIIVQGFIEDTEENWKVVDDFRNEIENSQLK